jgi:hypothetical protein
MSKSWPKRKKSCQKVVKKLSKKLSEKLSKKLSKKLLKSCQKVVKKFKKLTKGSAMYHWLFYVSREAIKRKFNKSGGWVGWVGGQIVVPRPSASASLTGRRQK